MGAVLLWKPMETLTGRKDFFASVRVVSSPADPLSGCFSGSSCPSGFS
jgi:hypothetical protein